MPSVIPLPKKHLFNFFFFSFFLKFKFWFGVGTKIPCQEEFNATKEKDRVNKTRQSNTKDQKNLKGCYSVHKAKIKKYLCLCTRSRVKNVFQWYGQAMYPIIVMYIKAPDIKNTDIVQLRYQENMPYLDAVLHTIILILLLFFPCTLYGGVS